MIIEVEHCTTYNYSEVVKQSIQFVRLSPRKSANQNVIEWQLSLPGDVFDVVDGFGNKISVVTCTGIRNKIEIVARGEVDITGQDSAPEPGAIPPDVFLKPSPSLRQVLSSRSLSEGIRTLSIQAPTSRP